jgi:hypothetical protein
MKERGKMAKYQRIVKALKVGKTKKVIFYQAKFIMIAILMKYSGMTHLICKNLDIKKLSSLIISSFKNLTTLFIIKNSMSMITVIKRKP